MHRPSSRTLLSSPLTRLCVVSLAGVLSAAAAPEPDALVVDVVGVRDARGTIGCMVFGSPEGFPDAAARASVRVLQPATPGTVTCVLEHVPDGRFAVAIMHDANNNGALDRGFFGAPKEGFAFSRDARPGAFSPPGFKDAAVDVGPSTRHLTVHLTYP